MAATLTTNLGLSKPDREDPAAIAVLNANFDTIDVLRRAIGGAVDVNRGLYISGPWMGPVVSHGVGIGVDVTAPPGGDATQLYIDGTIKAASSGGPHGIHAAVMIQPAFLAGTATVNNYEGLFLRQFTCPPGAIRAGSLVVDSPIGAPVNYSIINSGIVQMRGACEIRWEQVSETTDTTIAAATGANAYVPGSAVGDLVFRATAGKKFMFSMDTGATAGLVLTQTAVRSALNTFVGATTANAFATGPALTINQAGSDDEIVSLKSSDVAHGMTTITETDTYLSVAKATAASGGATLRGFAGATTGLRLGGAHTTGNTTKTSAATAAISLMASLKTGTTFGANGANDNLVVIADHATIVWLADKEGDTHQGGHVYPGTDALAMQAACGLLAGTGAPNNANGNNGDIYFRSDGGASTTVYQRRAGAWVGIV